MGNAGHAGADSALIASPENPAQACNFTGKNIPMTVGPRTPPAESLTLRQAFLSLQSHAPQLALQDARFRCRRLKALMQAVLKAQDAIAGALQADFGKCRAETVLSEILPLQSEIKMVCSHLSGWMAGRQVPTPLLLLGHRSRVMVQPKGVVLILSPWNFPVNLTFLPLVSAVAAGNAVVLKPSEHTPHTSAVIARIVAEVFPPEEVRLFEGGVDVAETLLELPFNHIFFTGSPAVGRIVMEKAARHLASVTLELGGKSPVIVDESADLRKAARRIVWGKLVNAGQICIAPDYVLVAEARKEDLILEMKKAVLAYYGSDPVASPDYARIINPHHYRRLASYLQAAREDGATIHLGGGGDPESRYMAPAIISGLPADSPLLHEEIFGPLLPVVAWQSAEEAIAFIQSRPKPLAIYLFSRDRKRQRYWLANTRAGGTAINTTMVHFYNSDLPFGGDNNSGIGKAHGYYGFLAFSNERALVREVFPWTSADLVAPPYRPWLQRIIQGLAPWL
jgi:aldehyde dehydrogenase (NAD+)